MGMVLEHTDHTEQRQHNLARFGAFINLRKRLPFRSNIMVSKAKIALHPLRRIVFDDTRHYV